MKALIIFIGLVVQAWVAHAQAQTRAPEVRFEPVAPGIYVHVGDIGARTVANQGLNANIGLVLTPEGAVLIDSGSTAQVASGIQQAIGRVTALPVRWVINTGTQDHRWLGNGWFAARGAELIGHANAVADMRNRGPDQLGALRSLLGTAADGTQPMLPNRLVTGSDTTVQLGGIAFTLIHRGGGHTPGDTMVWLPHAGVVFTGDIVYVDRLLGVIPVSHTGRWLDAFTALEALAPRVIVPGHGQVTTLATAREQTRDYLQALRAHARQAVDDGLDPSTAARRFDGSRWSRLANAAELGPANASRVFLEVERE